MRYNEKSETWLDLNYRKGSGLLHRLIIRLFRSHVNKVCKIVICRAHERGLVDSRVMHEQAAMVDKMLWPERWKGRQTDNVLLTDDDEQPAPSTRT